MLGLDLLSLAGPIAISVVGACFRDMRRNEQDPRSRQNFVGRHSGAISPP